MFKRRKEQDAPDGAEVDVDGFVDDLDDSDRKLEDAEILRELERTELEVRRAGVARPQGPWDAADAPVDPDRPRLDLGALQVPVPPDTEVRVDVSPEGEVVAATLVQGESSLQLNVFAAPRSEGIWDEVRTEIADALNAGGGQAREVQGSFGTELRADVPTEVPGQGVVLAPARFVGVDGPRWFLRGLVIGPAVDDPTTAAGLEAVLRDVVVARGGEPMAVRDPLRLVLPTEITDAAVTEQQEGLQMPERGPEITETR